VTKPSIVLVHGAFADATCWQHVIPLLERQGYYVTAVQNPLTSLEDDVATTRRVIDAQEGRVVVVGHSYGGVVMSGAAAGSDKVDALVFVAAFGPDAGEPIGPLLEQYPSAIGAALRPDAAGFLYIDRGLFRDVFAADVTETEALVMAATQKPINGTAFGAVIGQPAWRTIPSWYLVATADNAINPELQRFFATRMGATINEVASSHVPMISQPGEVARCIMQAAPAVSPAPTEAVR